MRVKLFSNYESSVNLAVRFSKNYIIHDSQIQIVSEDQYDYAVVFNGTRENISRDKKVITIVQEPSWSPLLTNQRFLENSDVVILHDRKLFENNYYLKFKGIVIESPSFMFYHDRLDYKSYFNTQGNKTRKLSVIMSNVNYGVANYSARLMLLDKILASDLDIDIYGRGLDINDRRYKGQAIYKKDGLLPYEYSIAIENSNEYNYISEKFIDCVLCNTIPIYNGAPNISEVYDQRYFKLIDIYQPYIINQIKSIIKEPAPFSDVNKEIYFNKFNLYTMLKRIIFDMAEFNNCL